MLNKHSFVIGTKDYIASSGISILTQYIPGKFWLIASRAAYLAEKKSLPLGELSVISLNVQLIFLLVGLIFSALGLFLVNAFYLWGWLALVLTIGLSLVIFTNLSHTILEKIVRKVFRKNLKIQKISLMSIFAVLPWFFLNWIFWSIGYYLFVMSISTVDVPLVVGLGFPLACVSGIIAFFMPAGLGAYEGSIIWYLILAGFPSNSAISISIATRLWDLTGTILFFLVGVIADRKSRIKQPI